MTIETISMLKELIAEKEGRLEAIGRRLEVLRNLVTNAADEEELSVYAHEVKDLGDEIIQLRDSRNNLKNMVNKFFKPAA